MAFPESVNLRNEVPIVELARRIRDGERDVAAKLLESHSHLLEDEEEAIELVYREFVLLDDLGERPDEDEFCSRFPKYQHRLKQLLEVDRQFNAIADPHAESLVDGDTIEEESAALKRIGQYDLIERIGQGGGGTVYKARQIGLDRLVAVKVITSITPRMAQARRFQQEAELAARLQHPGIVQIFDFGSDNGRLFLALELVNGGTLERVAASGSLAVTEITDLLIELARTVHFAHDHGVIHRDLKPANILMTEEGHPKIADFGLAKNLLDCSSIDQTQSGAILGTPSYMAPEQVAGKRSDIGRPTDVYGLGAVLYQLLTGRPPFVGDSALETLRLIREREPMPPSKLRPSMPRDLETICLKCLAKEPAGRFSSAADLAAELQRFAEGVPIHSRAVGRTERAWRWCRRQPVVSGLVGSLVVVTIVAFAVVLSLWRSADSNRAEAEKNFAVADKNLALSRQVVQQYVVGVSQDLRLRGEDLRPLRKQLLELAVPFFKSVIESYQDSDDLLREQGEAYYHLADISSEIGELERASQMCIAAVAVFETLANKTPEDAEVNFLLASALKLSGDHESRLGRYAEAEKHFLAAYPRLSNLVEAIPDETMYRQALASLHLNWGAALSSAFKLNDAEDHYKEAILLYSQLLEDTSDEKFKITLTTAYNNYGVIFKKRSQPALAVEQYLRGLAILAPIAVVRPSDPVVLDHQALLMSNLINAYGVLNEPDQAADYFLLAQKTNDKLVANHPSVADFRWRQVLISSNYARVLFDHDRAEEAEREFQRAHQLAQEYFQQFPLTPYTRADLYSIELNLAKLAKQANRPSEAAERFADLVGKYRGVITETPSRATNYFSYDRCVSETVRYMSGDNRHSEAIELVQGEMQQLEALAEAHPDVTSIGFVLDNLRTRLSDLRQAIGEPVENDPGASPPHAKAPDK